MTFRRSQNARLSVTIHTNSCRKCISGGRRYSVSRSSKRGDFNLNGSFETWTVPRLVKPARCLLETCRRKLFKRLRRKRLSVSVHSANYNNTTRWVIVDGIPFIRRETNKIIIAVMS